MNDNFDFILTEFACAISVDSRDSDRYSKQDVLDCRQSVMAKYNEQMADSKRWRWLRERLTHQHCGPTVGWGTEVLYPGDDPDEAIDAAMAKELKP
jgi:hypothetical protein